MMDSFKEFSKKCRYRLEYKYVPRPGSALNVEISQPSDRCILKTPSHWPDNCSGARWVLSGGDILVFGYCNKKCPERS